MNSKYLLIIIIASLCIVGLYQCSVAGKASYPEYRVNLGQVADFELRAPFDFPLLKSEEQLEQDQKQALDKLEKPYYLDMDILFAAHRNIDELFETLYTAAEDGNIRALRDKVQKSGYLLDETSLKLVTSPARLASAHTAIKEALSEIYRTGVYSEIYTDHIQLITGNDLSRQSLSKFYQLEQAKRKLAGSLSDPWAVNLVRNNASLILKPNLLIDQARYEEMATEAIASVPVSSGEILKDEKIIRKGDRINSKDLNALRSLTEEYKSRDIKKSPLRQLLGFTGLLLYVFAILFAFTYHYQNSELHTKESGPSFITLVLGLILGVLLALLCNLLGLESSLIPFAMLSIAAALLLGFNFALTFCLSSLLLIMPFINWDAEGAIILLLSSFILLVMIRVQRTQHEYLRIWLYLICSLALVSVATGMHLGSNADTLARSLGYLVLSSIVSVLGAAAIVAFFEKRWNRATKQVLLELLDFGHPLLKKLATTAEGTYHHSLIVGNLAERAAEAIGANPLLARVGSYYHDIGKIVNTEIFTENNENSSDVHQQFTAQESAHMIRDHVKEGVTLATKYEIPKPVIDIIVQHHGTSCIRYFLEEAQRGGEEVDKTQFQYPGPLPQSKEAALVMLADIVESTTKAKQLNNEQDIVRIIDTTIQRMIGEGQLREAPITFKELELAKEAMIPVLESIYRKRLDYPEIKSQ